MHKPRFKFYKVTCLINKTDVQQQRTINSVQNITVFQLNIETEIINKILHKLQKSKIKGN